MGWAEEFRAPSRARGVALAATIALAIGAGAAEAAPQKSSPKPAATNAAKRAGADAGRGKSAAAARAAADTVLAVRMVDLTFALDSVRAATGVPAMAAAVVERGRIVAAGATGVLNSNGARAVRLTDPFHVGPMAKAMTATAIATLVDDGVLSWEQTIGQAFPELAAGMNEAFAGVTLEMLLAQRGRLPAYVDLDGETVEALRSLAGTPAEQRLAFVTRVLVEEPQAAGDFWLPSEAAYTVAAAMAERAARMPWEALLEKRLFQPLRMKSAGFGPPATLKRRDAPLGHRCDEASVRELAARREAERVAGVVAGFEEGLSDAASIPLPGGVTLPESPCAAEEPGEEATVGAALAPAGDVHCSVVDLARFAAYHLRGAQPAGRALLGPDNWARLHADLDGNYEGYGMGWELSPEDGDPLALLQEGGAGTFFCRVIVYPRSGRAVVVVTNGGEPNGKRACEAGAAVARAWRGVSGVMAKGEK